MYLSFVLLIRTKKTLRPRKRRRRRKGKRISGRKKVKIGCHSSSSMLYKCMYIVKWCVCVSVCGERQKEPSVLPYPQNMHMLSLSGQHVQLL
jgi:hypothetical protein